MVVLLLSSAWAIPTQPLIYEWKPLVIDAQDKEAQIIRVASNTQIRALCEGTPSKPPSREAIIRDDERAVALVSGAWSEAIQHDDGWYFPTPPIKSASWVFRSNNCTFEGLGDRASSSGFARLEEGAVNESEFYLWAKQAAVFSPKQFLWLDDSAASTWWSRYLTLRPIGPHPSGNSHSVTADLKTEDGLFYSEDGLEWLPQKNQRHSIRTLFLGNRDIGCLYLDDTPYCQEVVAEENWSFSDGIPELKSSQYDGLTISKPIRWSVLSDDVPHSISIDGPLLYQITSAYPNNYHQSSPLQSSVYPPSKISPLGVKAPEQRPWTSLDSINTDAYWVMEAIDVQSENTAIWVELDLLQRWSRLRGIQSSDIPWLDKNKQFSIWIPHQSNSTCTLSLDAQIYTSIMSETRVHRFSWLSEKNPANLPALDGCQGKLRIESGQDNFPNPVLRRRYHELSNRGVYFLTKDDQPTWLRFSHPQEVEKAMLQLERRGGPSEVLFINYLPNNTENIVGDDGKSWRRPISLLLEPGWDGLLLKGPNPSLVRVSQQQEPEEEPEEFSFEMPTASLEGLRELSQNIYLSQSDTDRVWSLERRALMLATLGEPQLALLDARLALLLGGEEQTNTRLLYSRQIDQWLYPLQSWRPRNDDWVRNSVEAPLTEDALQSAQNNDYIQVAEEMTEANLDARIWWRKSILSGQELSRSQALNAYIQQLEYSQDYSPNAPFFWPLRTLSYDTSIHIRPLGIQLYRGPLPDPSSPGRSDIGEALYEDSFPKERRRTLTSDGILLMPPQEQPLELLLHCRPKSSQKNQGECEISIQEIDGEEQWELTSNIWGETAQITLPPSQYVRSIHANNTEGLITEVLLPEAKKEDGTMWELAANRPITFHVLGPTVLKVLMWSFDEMETQIQINQKGAEGNTSEFINVVGAQQKHIVVPQNGPVEIYLQSQDKVRLKVKVRDSKGGALDAPKEADIPPKSVVFITNPTPKTQRALPHPARPLTPPYAQRIRMRSGWSPNLYNFHSVQLEHFQKVPDAQRWWSAGLNFHQYIESVPIERMGPLSFETQLGLDWKMAKGPINYWLIADAEGGVTLSEPAAAQENLSLTLRADRWWNMYTQGLFRLSLHQYKQWGNHPGSYRSIVDNIYRQSHPLQLQPELEVRFIPSPWLRIQWQSGVWTNSEFAEDRIIDHWYGRVKLNYGSPHRWGRIYTSVDRRYIDLERSDNRTELLWGSFFHTSIWKNGLYLLEGRLQWDSIPSEEEWIIQTQIFVSRSPSGLGVIRPTRIAMRHSTEWGYDDSVNKRWRIPHPEEDSIFNEDPE